MVDYGIVSPPTTRIQADSLLLSAGGWWRYIKFALHILAR
jgi:hypothetical protein